MAPHADPSEEVALRVGSKVIGGNILYAALVDVAPGDQSVDHEPAQPLGRERVDLVVVDQGHL